jgi:transcriptional regulator with GAF, ATPase, and Fis domain
VFGDDGAAKLLKMKPTTLTSRLKKLAINRHQFVQLDA